MEIAKNQEKAEKKRQRVELEVQKNKMDKVHGSSPVDRIQARIMMKEPGTTYKEVALQLGVTPSCVWKWCNNKSKNTSNTVSIKGMAGPSKRKVDGGSGTPTSKPSNLQLWPLTSPSTTGTRTPRVTTTW